MKSLDKIKSSPRHYFDFDYYLFGGDGCVNCGVLNDGVKERLGLDYLKSLNSRLVKQWPRSANSYK